MIYIRNGLEVNEKMILTVSLRKDGFADVALVGSVLDRLMGFNDFVSDIPFYEVLKKIKEQENKV